MVIGSLAELEQGKPFILRGFERYLVTSGCICIRQLIVDHARYLQRAPSRSAHNCEKDAFSDCSSNTTSNLFPVLLNACTRPRIATRRKGIRFRILATNLDWVLSSVLRVLRRGVLTPRSAEAQVQLLIDAQAPRSL